MKSNKLFSISVLSISLLVASCNGVQILDKGSEYPEDYDYTATLPPITELNKDPIDFNSQEPYSPNIINNKSNLFNKSSVETLFFAVPYNKDNYDYNENHTLDINYNLTDTISNAMENQHYTKATIFSEDDKKLFYEELVHKDLSVPTDEYLDTNDKNFKLKGLNTNKYYQEPLNIRQGETLSNIKITLNNNSSLPAVITATARLVTNNAIFLVDNTISDQVSNEKLNQLGVVFTTGKKYVNGYFGQESDLDQNGKIIFVITPFAQKNVIGYFSYNDKVAKEFYIEVSPGKYNKYINKYTNGGDFLYVNFNYLNHTDPAQQDNFYGTLLHEYQHMIHYDTRHIQNKINSELDTWINEGLSMLAEYISGHTVSHAAYIRDMFAKKQGQSITDFKGDSYGYSLLFFRYLYEVYGSKIIKNIYLSPHSGIKAIEEAVGRITGEITDFNKIYQDFMIMIITSGKELTTNQYYNIKNFNYKPTEPNYSYNGFNIVDMGNYTYNKINLNGDYNRTFNLTPYSFHYMKWNILGNKNMDFTMSNNVKGIYTEK